MPALVAGIHALSADTPKQGVDGRDTGERSDAVLSNGCAGHDDTIASENFESHNSASCHSGAASPAHDIRDPHRQLSAGSGQFSLYDHPPGPAGDT
jgi:hypothetical protein